MLELYWYFNSNGSRSISNKNSTDSSSKNNTNNINDAQVAEFLIQFVRRLNNATDVSNNSSFCDFQQIPDAVMCGMYSTEADNYSLFLATKLLKVGDICRTRQLQAFYTRIYFSADDNIFQNRFHSLTNLPSDLFSQILLLILLTPAFTEFVYFYVQSDNAVYLSIIAHYNQPRFDENVDLDWLPSRDVDD